MGNYEMGMSQKKANNKPKEEKKLYTTSTGRKPLPYEGIVETLKKQIENPNKK